MRAFRIAVLLTCFALLASASCSSQALPTATGPGSYVTAGGGISGFGTDYGHNRIGGGFAYLDVNPTWRFGLEGEVRFLRWHTEEQVTESTYLGGARAIVWPRPARFAPYAKFLAGAGRITLPFGYAHGGFLSYASGAGIDVAVSDRISVRAIDFEYQHWPQFPYGALHPYGLSAGASVRLNAVGRFPKGRRVRH